MKERFQLKDTENNPISFLETKTSTLLQKQNFLPKKKYIYININRKSRFHLLGLLEGLREGPLGINREGKAIDGDSASLPGCHHENQRCHRRSHAQQPQRHLSHISFPEDQPSFRATVSFHIQGRAILLRRLCLRRRRFTPTHHFFFLYIC